MNLRVPWRNRQAKPYSGPRCLEYFDPDMAIETAQILLNGTRVIYGGHQPLHIANPGAADNR